MSAPQSREELLVEAIEAALSISGRTLGEALVAYAVDAGATGEVGPAEAALFIAQADDSTIKDANSALNYLLDNPSVIV